MHFKSFNKVENLILLLMLFLTLSQTISCKPSNSVTVKVKVSYKDSNPDNQLDRVDVISGGDATELKTIPAGKTRGTRLWPSTVSQPQLFLSYNFKGKRRYWDGPKMPRGKGYKIEVVIGGDGKVIEHKITQ
ncbi:MAG: hypothetical protein GY874_12060 [Desulfobacteraceae bacterium]|nr:hypothetical protein [Desulfobacteraceae bacterium]